MLVATMKRSSCPSGRGYVPWNWCGFWARNEEGLGEPARLSVDRDLTLGHRLEERALRSRCGAVDLVGQQDRREDRSGNHSKRTSRGS